MFLFGFLLAPVGAAIGSVIFFAVIALWSDSTSPTLPWDWLGMVLFGTGIGMIAALPTTVLVLPVAYLIVRRRSVATPAKLAVIGAVAGFTVSGGIILGFWGPHQDMTNPLFWAVVGGIAADGAVAGAICGAALGMMMRRMRPPTPGAPAF